MKINKMQAQHKALLKSPTGIQGLDEITGGDCRREDPHSSAAAQAAARQCLPWSFCSGGGAPV
jgi:hypothetical protein